MFKTLELPMVWRKDKLLFIFLLLSFTGIALYQLQGYFITNATTLLGIALIPFVFKAEKEKYSQRYLFPFLLFLVLAVVLQVKSFIFLASLFGILLFLETLSGRLSILVPVLIVTISPVFFYVSKTFGISIRFALSDIVAQFLVWTGNASYAVGNTIWLNEREFHVDPGCMGLSMISISVIIGIFILSYFEKQHNKSLPEYITILALFFILLLNILSNLIRILILVIFNIGPESLMHDLSGLLCLFVYVILPFYFFAAFIIRFSIHKEISSFINGKFQRIHIVIVAGFLVLLFSSFLPKKNQILSRSNSYSIKGYTKEKLSSGVYQFKKDSSLIYIKPIQGFYAAEHSPMVCWIGDGYELKNIEEKMIAGVLIYSGKLVKGDDILYTAWWFDNGEMITTSQWKWRLENIRSDKNFSLVNVTMENQYALFNEVNEIISKQKIKSNYELSHP